MTRVGRSRRDGFGVTLDHRLVWLLRVRVGEWPLVIYHAQRVPNAPGERDGAWDLDLLDFAGL